MPPTIELASRALEPITSREAEKATPTPCVLIEAVAESFQLTPADLLSRKRDKEVALARRVAMYFIRRETNCSVARIGQEMGGRDAAAVSNGCKNIADSLADSPFLQRKIVEIQQAISSVQKD